jgi:hypothetical protein
MKVYIKNLKDNKKFHIADVVDTVGFEELMKAIFDILKVNETQYLLILKENANTADEKHFFVGCFGSSDDVSAHIKEILIMEDDDKEDNEKVDN